MDTLASDVLHTGGERVPFDDKNYSLVMPFERSYDEPAFFAWMQDNWWLCFPVSAVYVILIFSIKAHMETREKFELRVPLAVWSAALGAFSVCGAARFLPELYHSLTVHGLRHSMCDRSFFVGPTAYWCYLFAWSKVWELGDTVFIVLRKQPLIFLHWYHHIATLIYAFHSYIDHTAAGRWFVTMNYSVHAVMYSYYAMRALRVRFPRWVNITITTSQLTQMVVGCIVNLRVYFIKNAGGECGQSYGNLYYSLVMYLSYYVLFAHFFYHAYIKPKVSARSPAKLQKAENEKTVQQHRGHVVSEDKNLTSMTNGHVNTKGKKLE